MAQTVIENKLYADLLNPIIDNSNLYPFKEIMGRVNIAGTNYRFDGQRSIIIRNLIAGKDVNADLQNYTANETQKWSNAEKTLTVRYSRKYRDFVAREYEVTGKPLNTAANVMAEYERTGRPETISSQYAENLYNIAKDSDLAKSLDAGEDVYVEIEKASQNPDVTLTKLFNFPISKRYL